MALLGKLLSYMPGTKARQKRLKLQQLRVLLKAQGQDVSNLDDDQLEYVAMEVRRQMKEQQTSAQVGLTETTANKTIH